MRTLLGSAPTLEGIQQVIKAFYAGESKDLRQTTPVTWTVHKSSGDELILVIVRLKKGRYRFERRS